MDQTNSKFQGKSSLVTIDLSDRQNRPSVSSRFSQSRRFSKQTLNEEVVNTEQSRILNEKGDDVTPRSLKKLIRINTSNRYMSPSTYSQTPKKTLVENMTVSSSQKSIFGTISWAASKSHYSYSKTMLSVGATIDLGRKLLIDTEHLFGKNQIYSKNNRPSTHDCGLAEFLSGSQRETVEDSSNLIYLVETETYYILELKSSIISADDKREHEFTLEKNGKFKQLNPEHHNSDQWKQATTQTNDYFSKTRSIITDPILLEEAITNVSDTFDTLAQNSDGDTHPACKKETKKNIITMSRQGLLKEAEHFRQQVDKSVSSKTTSSKSSRGFVSQDSQYNIEMTNSKCIDAHESDIDRRPEISINGFIMERMLNMNIFLNKQIHYRQQSNKEYKISNSDESNIEQFKYPVLDRLWYFSSTLTNERNVSCLAWNNKNHEILAVGYGPFQYNDDREGLICCWITINPTFPERYYQTDASITSISFSIERPHLLTVGLFDGNICIFDLNYNNTLPIISTNSYEKRHRGPVWQLRWYELERSEHSESFEALLSISSDGRIVYWTLRKEFETTDLLQLKSFNITEPINDYIHLDSKNNVDRWLSNTVGGLCFDVQPNDRTIYLCGTDEGNIFRCSMIENDKYLDCYRGHSHQIYRIQWSPFIDDIFLSASADWTVRIWMLGHETAAIELSSPNSMAYIDAIWSPKSPTIFFCITENTIDIWDLYQSTLDPTFTVNCSDSWLLTTMTYSPISDSLVIGTDDGAVWVYRLENVSSIGTAVDLSKIVNEYLLSNQCRKVTIDSSIDVSLK